QTDPPPVAFGYDHQALVQRARARLDAEELVQPDDRQVIAAERDDLGMAGEAGDAGRLELHRLHDGDERHDVGLAAHRNGLPVHDGERQRQGDDEARAAPGLALHFDLAVELFHVAPDDIHANTAPGEIGGLLRGGEPRHEDELVDLGIGRRVVRADEPAGARLGEDASPIEAAAIIAHLHGDVAAAVRGVEVHGTLGGLARRNAYFRRLDAVIEAVAYEVHQRVADLLEHRLVELGLLAGELELDLLAEALREIAYHAREAAEDEADGQHAYAHDALLQLAYVAFELSQAATQLLCVRPVEMRAELAQNRLRDHELTDGIHELIDLLDAHPDRARVTEAAHRGFRFRRILTGRGGNDSECRRGGRFLSGGLCRRCGRRRCRLCAAHGRRCGHRSLGGKARDSQVAVTFGPLEHLSDRFLRDLSRQLERPREIAVLRIQVTERGQRLRVDPHVEIAQCGELAQHAQGVIAAGEQLSVRTEVDAPARRRAGRSRVAGRARLLSRRGCRAR